MAEVRKCKISGKDFEITDEDIEFYEKLGVSLPTISPEERERRRLVWRNERHLFKRNCGLCKKSIIAIYPEECPFPIYCEDCFWSDKWDPLSYGRDFDFNRPFFSQFADLADAVPRLAITHANSVNSDYTLNSVENKNCYLTSGADYNVDCYYAIASQRSKKCVDTFLVYDSEFCYGCLDSTKINLCVGCQECENCTDCWFLYDCKGCRNCAFSANLRDKNYVLFNKQLTTEEYANQLASILNQLFENPNWMNQSRRTVREKAIHRDALIIGGGNVSGNYVRNSKNSFNIFDAENLENCKYAYYAADLKDSYDVSCTTFDCRSMYEVMSSCNASDCLFSNAVLYDHNAQYCITCFHSSDIFGCISMKHHKYVILDKQYSREEYRILKAQIIEYMKKTQEYGRYFPPWLSPFGYNQSAAIDYMPLNKEDANELGYLWYDDAEASSGDVYGSDNYQCLSCTKSFRLISQELDFYRGMNIPLPGFCWACRLRKLIDSRKPWKLFDNNCRKCGIGIKSPISAKRPEQVYCNDCYKEAIIDPCHI